MLVPVRGCKADVEFQEVAKPSTQTTTFGPAALRSTDCPRALAVAYTVHVKKQADPGTCKTKNPGQSLLGYENIADQYQPGSFLYNR